MITTSQFSRFASCTPRLDSSGGLALPSGMATGTWLAGIIYDHYGYYAPAFAAGVGFNLLNLAAIGTLVLRRRFAR